MLFAGLSLLNTVLSYFYIECFILSYIGSVSILTVLLMYLMSVTFNFCVYHRMFIHYTTINWLLNIYDWYIGIPLERKELYMLYAIITCVSLFFILYLKFRK